MPRIGAVAAFAAAIAVLATSTSAQVRTAYPEKRGLALSQFPRTIKLAENVYGYEDIRQPGFTTVSLFVVGNDGVLLADGQGSPAATQRLLDAIKAVTPKPLKWYIVGSDHGDHTAGNSVLPKDVTYVIHPNSLAQMQRDAANPNRQAKAPPVIVPAAAMTGATQSIDVGGIEVRAMFLGRAHTGGDLMVYLPKQRLLFMSEAYLNRVFPAMRSAYPSEWVATIDKALALDVERYVPGHGFIEEPKVSREELLEFQQALKAVNAEVKRLHDQGLSADAATAQANWGPYTDWFLRDQQAPIAVGKVYEEIEGKLK
jgi:glyoxylase-like metal-dependent hydrolase (beta-lactamase superfamily II)